MPAATSLTGSRVVSCGWIIGLDSVNVSPVPARNRGRSRASRFPSRS